jgi:hypothetical protein
MRGGSVIDWNPEKEASDFGARRILHTVHPDLVAGICKGFASLAEKPPTGHLIESSITQTVCSMTD